MCPPRVTPLRELTHVCPSSARLARLLHFSLGWSLRYLRVPGTFASFAQAHVAYPEPLREVAAVE